MVGVAIAPGDVMHAAGSLQAAAGRRLVVGVARVTRALERVGARRGHREARA